MNGGGGGLVVKLYPTLATPWIIACQAPLSIGFSRQEYWCPPPGDIPDWGIKPSSPVSPALVGGLFTTNPPGMLTENEKDYFF